MSMLKIVRRIFGAVNPSYRKIAWVEKRIDLILEQVEHLPMLTSREIARTAEKVKLRESMLSESEANDWIREKVASDTPLMISRLGANECNALYYFIVEQNSQRNSVFSAREQAVDRLYWLAGFFPKSESLVKEFCQLYLECLECADLMALWNFNNEPESGYAEVYCRNLALVKRA